MAEQSVLSLGLQNEMFRSATHSYCFTAKQKVQSPCSGGAAKMAL